MSGSRFVPGRWLAASAGAALPLTLFGGASLAALAAFDGALLAAAWIESRVAERRAPEARRALEPRFVVGEPSRVRVELHNRGKAALRVTVRDDVPDGFRAEPEELGVVLPPHARRELEYVVTPTRRGALAFGDLHLRVEGPLGLGARVLDVPAAREVRVYPRILGALGRELASRLAHPRSLGARMVRRRGGGGEFDQLREYVRGDPFRELDWKSSAKRRRPITRVLREERSQSVLVALDLGRLMSVAAGDADARREPRAQVATKLDHAIDAALLLAWTALRNGDRVGLVLFAENVKGFVPPRSGPTQYRVILDALYDAQARPVTTDFRRFSEFVKSRVPRRSLIVLFSDLLDDTHATPLAEHLAKLRAKHLPVCVSMEDATADALAERPPEDDDDVYRRAAAADLLADRGAVKALLQRGGVGLVEAKASELAVHAIERYLDIKARSAL